MARIGGRDTSPERLLRSALWARGLRYRLHAQTPAGRPDIVLRAAKVAVYVDGCQWHGCPEHYVRPRTRTEFWADKLATSVERDRRQTLLLEAEGWRVDRIWEHEVYEQFVWCVDLVGTAVRDPDWAAPPAMQVVKVETVTEDGNVERRHLEALRILAGEAGRATNTQLMSDLGRQ